MPFLAGALFAGVATLPVAGFAGLAGTFETAVGAALLPLGVLAISISWIGIKASFLLRL